jgi:hemoglobin
MEIETRFGIQDASFRAAGGEAGVRHLVRRFYELMDTLPEAAAIRAMHPPDLESAIDRLACFLYGWLGGPPLYREKYGSIDIPKAHAHLQVGADDRDAWLRCMALAVEEQPYSEAFRSYLLAQLRIPAERIRLQSEAATSG